MISYILRSRHRQHSQPIDWLTLAVAGALIAALLLIPAKAAGQAPTPTATPTATPSGRTVCQLSQDATLYRQRTCTARYTDAERRRAANGRSSRIGVGGRSQPAPRTSRMRR